MQHTEIGDADMGYCVPVYCEGIVKLPQMDLDRLVHGGSLFDEHIIQRFSPLFTTALHMQDASYMITEYLMSHT